MFSVIKHMNAYEHEQVVFCNDKQNGLKAIIALHNTKIGPAFGGCRMWNYKSEDDALYDVLRLSRSMTYKAAMSKINLGGGKAIIFGDSKKDKNKNLFKSFGRFVEGLAGRYITAEDVGTSVKNMEWVRSETSYVTGISHANGGSGDPSPVTALGAYSGIKATVKNKLGKDSLFGLKIGVQGVGNVGYHLCKYLNKEGVILYVSDVDQNSLKRVVNDFGAKIIDIESIYSSDIDVYAPCALGGTVNDFTIPKLKCSIIAGAANNQLEKDIHAQILYEKDILYAPDYVINAGGLINCAHEIEGYNEEAALLQAEHSIYDNLIEVYKLSSSDQINTHEAAMKIANIRMNDLAELKNNLKFSKKDILDNSDNI